MSNPTSLKSRVMEFIMPEPNSGCWLWTGRINTMGYGVITTPSPRGHSGNRVKMAHRICYSVLKEPIPEGKTLLHKCDTPACVNPDHLIVGTHRDNAHDKIRKGRWKGTAYDLPLYVTWSNQAKRYIVVKKMEYRGRFKTLEEAAIEASKQ